MITPTIDPADDESDQDYLPQSGKLRSGKRRKVVSFDESLLSSVGNSLDTLDHQDLDEDDEAFQPGGHNSSTSTSEDEHEHDQSGGIDRPSKCGTGDESTSDDDEDEEDNIPKVELGPSASVRASKALKNHEHESEAEETEEEGSTSGDSSNSSMSSSSTSSSSDDDSSDSGSRDDVVDSKPDATDMSSDFDAKSSSSDDEGPSTSEDSWTLVGETKPPSPGPLPTSPEPEQHTPTVQKEVVESVPPGNGRSATRNRNQRRARVRQAKKLAELDTPDEKSGTQSLESGTGIPASEQVLHEEPVPEEQSLEQPNPDQHILEQTIAENRILEQSMTEQQVLEHEDTEREQKELLNALHGEDDAEFFRLLDSLPTGISSGAIESVEDLVIEHLNRVVSDTVMTGVGATKLATTTTSAGPSEPFEMQFVPAPTMRSTEASSSHPARLSTLDFLKSGLDTVDDPVFPNSTVENVLGKQGGNTEPRATLDVESSRRLVFGSLGVRAPRSKEEEDDVRASLKKRNSLAVSTALKGKPVNKKIIFDDNEYIPSDNGPATLEVSTDLDGWESGSELSASECTDPTVHYPPPPFPFKQFWHAPAKPTRGKKRKRGRRDVNEESYLDTQEADYGIGKGDGLDYDDGYYDEPTGESASDTLNVNTEPSSQLLNEIVQSSNITEKNVPATLEDEDLPTLPADITALPDLNFFEARLGAIIAFKQLECTEATRYHPTISGYRTAIVDSAVLGDQTLTITLAKRDRKIRKQYRFDRNGKKILGKLDLIVEEESDEENAEDDGERKLYFKEMVEPKLVRASSAVVQADDYESNSVPPETQVVKDSVGDAMDIEPVEAKKDGQEEEVQQDSMFTNDGIDATADVQSEA